MQNILGSYLDCNIPTLSTIILFHLPARKLLDLAKENTYGVVLPILGVGMLYFTIYKLYL